MRIDVLKPTRLKLVRTVAIAGFAGLAAGCSSDVARFDDGFYTGAVPQAPLTQTASAQPYPGDLDRTNTGSIQGGNLGAPNYPSAPGGYQGNASTYSNAPTSSVQSNQLPPPPASTYAAAPRQPSTPGLNAATASSTYNDRSVVLPADRGAPPSTLQEQARRVSTPQSRPASSPSRTASAGTVTVESGDTLLGISRRTGVSVDEIRRANDISGNTIRLGQKLVVPGAGGSTKVASLEPVKAPTPTIEPKIEAKPAETPATSVSQTADKSSRPSASAAEAPTQSASSSSVASESQKVASIAPDATGISGFRWPAQGRVVSRFGEKVGSRRNDGLNISVPRGTPIKAAENGVVIYAGDGLKEFGNTVLVQHEDGLVTVYGHADSLEVKRGAKVTRGQEIAKSGMSGDTDVPIVHFEVRKNSTPVDPKKYLQ